MYPNLHVGGHDLWFHCPTMKMYYLLCMGCSLYVVHTISSPAIRMGLIKLVSMVAHDVPISLVVFETWEFVLSKYPYSILPLQL